MTKLYHADPLLAFGVKMGLLHQNARIKLLGKTVERFTQL